MNNKIKNHFKKNDPILYSYIEKIELFEHKPSSDLFVELCEAIINQQLSDKAAATIFQRFKNLFPKGRITPRAFLKLPDAKIRSCGTSNAKVKFLKDLAKKVASGKLNLERLRELTDGEVIVELTKVHGIGPWTAEMFLMFALGREDVFSHGDLGLRNAIKKIYRFKKEPSRKQIEKIVAKWSPYKTHACRILWRSLIVNRVR